MTRKTNKQFKFVALIMSLVMLMTAVPLSAYAEEGANITPEAINPVVPDEETMVETDPIATEPVTLTAADVPEFIAMTDLTARGTIRRLYEEETDLSTVLFENNDGSRTLFMYGVPVKYVAPNGAMRDKSTEISALTDLQPLWDGTTLTPDAATTLAQNASMGRLDIDTAVHTLTLMNTRLAATYGTALTLSDIAYATLDSDIRSLYPTVVSDGIVLNYGDYSIRTIPITTGSLVLPGMASVVESTSLTDGENRTRVRYNNTFGLGTVLQYTPTMMGMKEEVILTSNIGKNAFSFLIETDGLTIEEENGNYFFFDSETQTSVAQLGKVIAYDSNGQMAYGATEVVTIREGQQYGVTISVSQEFLATAAYPVSVDPPIAYEIDADEQKIQFRSAFDTEAMAGYADPAMLYLGKHTSSDGDYHGRIFTRIRDFQTHITACNIQSQAQLGSLKLYYPGFDAPASAVDLLAYGSLLDWPTGSMCGDLGLICLTDSNSPCPAGNEENVPYVDLTDIAKKWMIYDSEAKTGVNPDKGIIVMLYDEDNDSHRVWYMDVYAVLDYAYLDEVGVFYLNNGDSGEFLSGATGSNGTALDLTAGLIEDIGNEISWTFRYAGDRKYYIQSAEDSSLYISAIGSLVTTPFAWTVSYATGGGINITNGNYALGVNALGDIVISSILSDNQKQWRKISESRYNELTDSFTIHTVELNVGDSIVPRINPSPANASWVKASDFIFSANSTDCVLINNEEHSITAQKTGTVIITAQHKITKLSKTFSIVVSTSEVYLSPKQPGYEEDNIIAADMVTSNKSKWDLYNISLTMGDLATQYDLPPASSSVLPAQGPEVLYGHMQDLVALFAFSDAGMQNTVQSMINHFLDGSGTSYSSEVLTQTIRNHNATTTYINRVKEQLCESISSNNGDLTLAIQNMDKTGFDSLPVYGSSEDYTNGLKVCWSSTWGGNIEVTAYAVNSNSFSGSLQFVLFDHFGLDDADVTGKDDMGWLLGYTNQFASWYVLQHYQNTQHDYKPFITYVTFEVEFSGYLS